MAEEGERISRMLASPKLRISEATLRDLEAKGTPSDRNILVLLSDVGVFERNWAQNELFRHSKLEKSSKPVVGELPVGRAMIWEEGVPGPIVVGRFTLEQVEKLLQWEEVVQVEESKEFTVLEDDNDDATHQSDR